MRPDQADQPGRTVPVERLLSEVSAEDDDVVTVTGGEGLMHLTYANADHEHARNLVTSSRQRRSPWVQLVQAREFRQASACLTASARPDIRGFRKMSELVLVSSCSPSLSFAAFES
jgi:hypothetical protein